MRITIEEYYSKRFVHDYLNEYPVIKSDPKMNGMSILERIMYKCEQYKNEPSSGKAVFSRLNFSKK